MCEDFPEIPYGATAKILIFISGIKDEGNQWFYVNYNGKVGYIKYEINKMYLTNE